MTNLALIKRTALEVEKARFRKPFDEDMFSFRLTQLLALIKTMI